MIIRVVSDRSLGLHRDGNLGAYEVSELPQKGDSLILGMEKYQVMERGWYSDDATQLMPFIKVRAYGETLS